MEQITLYIILFAVVVLVGQLFNKTAIPIALLLIITGMLLSFIPGFPTVRLNPDIVLDVFLPLMVYEISVLASWQEMRKNYRPIALLSIGHVIFITLLIAATIHALLPQMGWPLAFVLGAVISPPDDVAIVSIAEKIRMPARIVTILEGEGIFNDATALILFRFALAATVSANFSAVSTVATFFAVLIGETLYGLVVGYVVGWLRSKIKHNFLHVIASVLTPFIAYYPAVMLGGCGVLATVVAGSIIGNVFALRFTPSFRLISRAIWPSLTFALQSILFLLVGLNLKTIMESISALPLSILIAYAVAVVLVMILGRFIWVYGAVYLLPRALFPGIRKKDPLPPWQYPFVVSWAGMRGGISLAAALAVPTLPAIHNLANPRDLIIFLVFCAIVATLLFQGLSLPWLLKKLGLTKHGKCEEYNLHIAELSAKLTMTQGVLQWLPDFRRNQELDKRLIKSLRLKLKEYRMQEKELQEKLKKHQFDTHDIIRETERDVFLSMRIIEVEKELLIQLWREEKITVETRDKLLEQLDHRAKNLSV
jgi:Na+/H+ antiporter